MRNEFRYPAQEPLPDDPRRLLGGRFRPGAATEFKHGILPHVY